MADIFVTPPAQIESRALLHLRTLDASSVEYSDYLTHIVTVFQTTKAKISEIATYSIAKHASTRPSPAPLQPILEGWLASKKGQDNYNSLHGMTDILDRSWPGWLPAWGAVFPAAGMGLTMLRELVVISQNVPINVAAAKILEMPAPKRGVGAGGHVQVQKCRNDWESEDADNRAPPKPDLLIRVNTLLAALPPPPAPLQAPQDPAGPPLAAASTSGSAVAGPSRKRTLLSREEMERPDSDEEGQEETDRSRKPKRSKPNPSTNVSRDRASANRSGTRQTSGTRQAGRKAGKPSPVMEESMNGNGDEVPDSEQGGDVEMNAEDGDGVMNEDGGDVNSDEGGDIDFDENGGDGDIDGEDGDGLNGGDDSDEEQHNQPRVTPPGRRTVSAGKKPQAPPSDDSGDDSTSLDSSPSPKPKKSKNKGKARARPLTNKRPKATTGSNVQLKTHRTRAQQGASGEDHAEGSRAGRGEGLVDMSGGGDPMGSGSEDEGRGVLRGGFQERSSSRRITRRGVIESSQIPQPPQPGPSLPTSSIPASSTLASQKTAWSSIQETLDEQERFDVRLHLSPRPTSRLQPFPDLQPTMGLPLLNIGIHSRICSVPLRKTLGVGDDLRSVIEWLKMADATTLIEKNNTVGYLPKLRVIGKSQIQTEMSMLTLSDEATVIQSQSKSTSFATAIASLDQTGKAWDVHTAGKETMVESMPLKRFMDTLLKSEYSIGGEVFTGRQLSNPFDICNIFDSGLTDGTVPLALRQAPLAFLALVENKERTEGVIEGLLETHRDMFSASYGYGVVEDQGVLREWRRGGGGGSGMWMQWGAGSTLVLVRIPNYLKPNHPIYDGPDPIPHHPYLVRGNVCFSDDCAFIGPDTEYLTFTLSPAMIHLLPFWDIRRAEQIANIRQSEGPEDATGDIGFLVLFFGAISLGESQYRSASGFSALPLFRQVRVLEALKNIFTSPDTYFAEINADVVNILGIVRPLCSTVVELLKKVGEGLVEE